MSRERKQRLTVLLLTGAVFEKGVVRDMIEKKVSRYLDKTASLSTIVSEIELLVGAPS